MTVTLFFQAFAKFLAGLFIVSLLLFLPAGTLAFWNGWLLILLLFVPMFIAGIVMMIRDPGRLRIRLDAKESESEQKIVIALSALMFIAAFVVSGLNYRFGWLVLPEWTVIAASVVFAAAYCLYGEVLRENAYLSRTVGVMEKQKVIDTGLYAVVRHPMYSSTLLLFLSMGFVLGSLFSFLILLLYIPIIAKRIENEEKVLEEGLEGYSAYKKRVKRKLIPFIW